MSREILFKAKRKDNGEWAEGYFFDDGMVKTEHYFVGDLVIEEYKGTACDEWDITGIGFVEVDPSTLCQYTGKRDKNGKKIFEGDILDGFSYPYCYDGEHNYYAEVCWFEEVCAFGLYIVKYPNASVSGISEGCTELMENWNPQNWEVIGNIFDNKDGEK